MARVDYDRMAPRYDRARAIALEGLEDWRAALAGRLDVGGGLPLLDLGAGTGLWAVALAGWFGVRVIGVEPSQGMRRVARRDHPHPDVAYVGGEASRIPLRDGCCAGAWLSAVVHHLPDVPACAGELRRVLRPGGRVLIRGAFAGRLEGVTLFRFFPGAGRIAETFPSVAQVAAAFATAGFGVEALERVAQVSAPSLEAAAERVRLRADTTLQLLSDEEFEEGVRALERAVAGQPHPSPVVDRLDLLVLRADG
jgi:SAM-dependent methyltransferase